MKSLSLKLIVFLLLLAVIVYLNWANFTRFFIADNKNNTVIAESYQKALNVIEPLRQFNFALPEVDLQRIELSLNDASSDLANFNLDNPSLSQLLDGNFTLEKEGGKIFLKKNASADLFISDYATKLNNLFENVRRIDSIALNSNKDAIEFSLVQGKRLSLDSAPINSILDKNKFDWIYDLENSKYIARIKDSPYLLNLGLDLRGGTYLDIGLDQAGTIKNMLAQKVIGITNYLNDKAMKFVSISSDETSAITIIKEPGSELTFETGTTNQPLSNNLFADLDIDQAADKVILSLSDDSKKALETDSIDQAIGIIRDRIDSLGVKDPSIQKKGDNSIVVQLPGQTDSARIKELITQPANLEFRLVAENESTNDVETLPYETLDAVTGEVLSEQSISVTKKVDMRGDSISDSRVAFDQYTGVPQVSFTLTPEGAQKFAEVTRNNVGRSLAIVLDNKIKSYPRINQSILGGQGQITGNFSVEEARDLSIVLRSGALPAALSVEQEQVVGASLGEDSVYRSLYSFVIGFLALAIFMCFYYRISGVISIIALLFNALMIISILSIFGATLTLPGIAGIILTIAMAVDANVLIYERIREELLQQASAKTAVQQGFKRVAVTILDSNITTLIVAAVLFQFGTGPIRGFALTLAIGIVTTVFSSLVISHWLFDFYYSRKNTWNKISI